MSGFGARPSADTARLMIDLRPVVKDMATCPSLDVQRWSVMTLQQAAREHPPLRAYVRSLLSSAAHLQQLGMDLSVPDFGSC